MWHQQFLCGRVMGNSVEKRVLCRAKPGAKFCGGVKKRVAAGARIDPAKVSARRQTLSLLSAERGRERSEKSFAPQFSPTLHTLHAPVVWSSHSTRAESACVKHVKKIKLKADHFRVFLDAAMAVCGARRGHGGDVSFERLKLNKKF